MYKYEAFEKEWIGKRRNKWTFMSTIRKKNGHYSQVFIVCQCDCGSIAHYDPYYCMSINFPTECIICSRTRKKLHWFKEREVEEEFFHDLSIPDQLDDLDTISIYGEIYKRYYRD
jgi:hypothetical protein